MADFPIKLEVSLPSGCCETVTVLPSGTIADLKVAAQQSFGQRFLRLAAADGNRIQQALFACQGFKMVTALLLLFSGQR